jgi:hypothetical protein
VAARVRASADDGAAAGPGALGPRRERRERNQLIQTLSAATAGVAVDPLIGGALLAPPSSGSARP